MTIRPPAPLPFQSGTFAARPAATAVPDGFVYWATDLNDGTSFRSVAGAWVNVSPARVLASVRLNVDFTMTTAATAEDVPAFTTSFTYDGRPVKIRLDVPAVSQDQAASRLITFAVKRTSDSASQILGFAQTDATANSLNQIFASTTWISAWPSDAAAFVVGTTYGVKANLTSGAASKAKIPGTTAAALLEVVTG